MAVFDIALDVHKRTRPVPRAVTVRVGDVGTQTIRARLTDDGEAYSPKGKSARLDILKADGTWARLTASLSGDTVSCTLDSKAVSSPGMCRLAHFVLTGDGTAESTEGFALNILPNVDGSAQESSDYDDRIEGLIAKWLKLEEEAAASEKARSDAEALRKRAESTRETAEESRKEAESKRVSAEAGRVNAEKLRAEAEKRRQTAETTRETSEKDRQTEESKRVEAESGRAEAEAKREADTAAAIDASNAALALAAAFVSSSTGSKDDLDAFGHSVAETSGRFAYIGGTAYCPSARASVSGSKVALPASSVNGKTARLA